ncbi:MAG: carbohydrate ABC transporter permease [Chthonomonas sp.]|nr:carbohydrate ABC transporter permease [Chthonomonas sp.]
MKLTRATLTWLFLAIVILPFVWIVFNSFKPGNEIISHPWSLPKSPNFANYVNAWTKSEFSKYFVNSLVTVIMTLAILIPISAMASYVLAKFPFRGSKLILSGFSAGMIVPQFLAIVPLFMLAQMLHLYNTQLGLILIYVAFSLPFTVFVLFGFFQILPDELIESASVDGASHAQTFWRVMLPLAKPGLLVALIFNIIGLWNEYSLALVLISDTDKYTMPVGMGRIMMTQQYQGDWGALFAGMVIVMVPLMIVYFVFREKIQQTMVAGAVKG